MKRLAFLLLTGAVLPLACSNPERSRLERGMEFARLNLERTRRDPAAQLSLASMAEMGGTLVQYLAANAAPDADLPRFTEGRPEAPWTVVLRQMGGGVVVLEGYGEDLSRPVLVDTARIATGPMR